MNEAETRAEHVDPALAAQGWGVVREELERRRVHSAGWRRVMDQVRGAVSG